MSERDTHQIIGKIALDGLAEALNLGTRGRKDPSRQRYQLILSIL
ncbi:MAG TPA: hypothetical protein VFN35_03270 [Ktedonobacteraceae bacterium]|nr:hypothetical protein [Ktedonobacteraceae bacterium]